MIRLTVNRQKTGRRSTAARANAASCYVARAARKVRLAAARSQLECDVARGTQAPDAWRLS
jgi:hypothetical protein